MTRVIGLLALLFLVIPFVELYVIVQVGHVIGLLDTFAVLVLVSLVGGSDLTMTEINRVMEQVNRQCEHAHVVMGAALDEAFANRLAVTVVTGQRKAQPEEKVSLHDAGGGVGESGFLTSGTNQGRAQGLPEPAGRPPSRFVAPPPSYTAEQMQKILAEQNQARSRLGKVKSGTRQGVLPLEIVSKGRFEKSEPTICQGQDLDVPTYIRRGVALN